MQLAAHLARKVALKYPVSIAPATANVENAELAIKALSDMVWEATPNKDHDRFGVLVKEDPRETRIWLWLP